MVSRHFASSGRDALRPKDGAERSSCLLSSRSSACFKICKCLGECAVGRDRSNGHAAAPAQAQNSAAGSRLQARMAAAPAIWC